MLTNSPLSGRGAAGRRLTTGSAAHASCRAATDSVVSSPNDADVTASSLLSDGSSSTVGDGGRGQLSCSGDVGLVVGAPLVAQRHRREGRHQHQRHHQPGYHGAADPPAPHRPPVGGGSAGDEELAFGRAEGDVAVTEQLELGETAAAEQVVGVVARALPLVDGLGQPAVQQQLLAAIVDPSVEPVPLGQQRLVGDLDGRGAGDGMAVERQQPVLAEAVENRVDGGRLEREAAQLAPGHPAACVLRRLADGHQPEEHLAGGLATGGVELAVESVGATPEGADHPTGALVVGGRQNVGRRAARTSR